MATRKTKIGSEKEYNAVMKEINNLMKKGEKNSPIKTKIFTQPGVGRTGL